MPERDGIRHVTKTYFLPFIHIIGCCKYICQKFRPKIFVKKSLIFSFICMVNHQLVIKRGIKGSRVSNPPALMARDADYMTFLVLSQSHPTSTRFPLENCHWQQETTLICEVPHHVSDSQVYEFLKAVTVSSPKNISAQQQGRTEVGGGTSQPWAFSEGLGST